ncbi:DUF779 domain-containing protein [Geodermatophilaceae bacterium NBWT11]|nr:DUF779 domain-containing protein [Geodermatophilaceae bacterium NBWT11]
MTGPAVDRVAITPEAAVVIRRLRGTHGPLMFHQSGGCCDGSAPMCYPRGDFIVGDEDVLLGLLDDTSPGTPAPALTPGQPVPDELSPVWISGPQFLLWQHTQLLLDVVPGRGAGFSLEAPEGVRFLTRSRVFDADEQAWLDACPAPRGRDLQAPG